MINEKKSINSHRKLASLFIGYDNFFFSTDKQFFALKTKPFSSVLYAKINILNLELKYIKILNFKYLFMLF